MIVHNRSKVNILINNWHNVDGDFNDKLCADITVFIINFIIRSTSIDDHLLFFSLILISTIFYKHMKFLLF